MRDVIPLILKEINKKQLYENMESLWKLELPQTFRAYAASSARTLELLKQAGIKNAEIVNFPADGKTVYQDKRMPLAWDASIGKLTIKKSPVPFSDPVVADYQRHPFSLVKGSVSAPAGGRLARIITESQLFAGEDAVGAMVICDPFTAPRAEILTAALDMGALGLITDYRSQQHMDETSDAISWVNACTEGMHWHVQCEDRPFICFSVNRRTGDQLRLAANAGELKALVECDGKRHAGILPGVTALVPGRQKKELWLMAHLYEPLSDDNSTGVAGAIEIVRIIKKLVAQGELPELEFSIRVVFASEMYGFAAFADKFGGYLGDKVIGAINLDSLMSGNPGQKLHVYLAPPGSPFFGNALMEMLVDECTGKDSLAVAKLHESGDYGDDMCLSDSTVGLPTLWAIGKEKHLWHNSALTMKTIDMDIFSGMCAFIGTWVSMVTTLSRAKLPGVLASAGACAIRHINEEYRRVSVQLENSGFRPGTDIAREISERMRYRLQIDIARLRDFSEVASLAAINHEIKLATRAAEQLIDELHKKASSVKKGEGVGGKWFAYASSIIPARATIGFPHDQAGVPKAQRRTLPDSMIYGPFARILSNMDGQKNLQRLIRETEWEVQTIFTDSQVKKYIGAVMYLADYGYLNVNYKRSLGQKEIVEALRKVGVQAGDCLFVHSSTSVFGRIEGGAETVVNAIIAAAGKNGTILLPTFTESCIYFEGALNKNRKYRPFDKNNPAQIWVGKIPQAFLERKNICRSNHPSHSVAGIGTLAGKCIKAHKESDPPTGKNSPFAKLLELNGKILYFGSGLGSSTFLHFIEDYMGLPYLKGSVCRVKCENGDVRTVYVPDNLPGDRDFYHEPAEKCKFFSRAVKDGLTINEAPLGLGKLRLIDVQEFFNIGIKLIKEEPDILLCDDPDCFFCQKNKLIINTGKTKKRGTILQGKSAV